MLRMADTGSKKRSARLEWLLLLPAFGLLFPAIYARETPALFGFPFFYWYQFAWVFLTAASPAWFTFCQGAMKWSYNSP